jgi:cobalt/nickel transport system permease protein
MHIPDGFLSPAVWATLDVAALPAVGWVARRAQRDTDERSIPLMGVIGAFVFAAQMINFPVGLGTSGHLVGGALLSIVLGPPAASVVLTAILVIQAFVFQDGGIMALGPNVFNMAIVGVLAAYLPYRLLGLRWKAGAIFLAGITSVMASALVALSQLLLSGVRMPGRLLWASLGFFFVSGLIEGAITVAAVRAIGRLNPNWVRDPKRAESRAWTVLAGAAVVLVIAGVLVASQAPDAIQQLALKVGLHGVPGWVHAPLTDYAVPGLQSAWERKAGAGLAGMLLIFAACSLTGRLCARYRSA